MKVLILVSGNSEKLSPFVQDQVDALKKLGVNFCYYFIRGHGVIGYLGNYKYFVNCIRKEKPDLIHAHYGLSGLVGVMQTKIPVITTFHGCDVNILKNRVLSKFVMLLGAQSIFVSIKLAKKLGKKNPIVIPCGVDFNIFRPDDEKWIIRKNMGLKKNVKYILFSSHFSNQVKNYPLARAAVEKINLYNINLIELKGLHRTNVAKLLNAVDLLLLTSFREGSPQIVKEAMACNCPVVSTNVGDVKDIIQDIDGCYLSGNSIDEVSEEILSAINFNKRTNGRPAVKHMDNVIIAEKVLKVYESTIGKKNV